MTGLWVLWVIYTLALFIDVLYVQPWRGRTAGTSQPPGAISFGLRAALPLFTLLLVLRTFVIDVYHVPSGSMRPLLDEGSRIWVNRLAYGIRSPITGAPLYGDTEPQRGDVIVFQYPREPRTTYVKRVLAIAGDHLEITGSNIRINGHELIDHRGPGPLHDAEIGSVKYRVLDQPRHSSESTPIDLTVPPGHYFTLGDNLANSQDSRVWGLLEHRNLLGRVIL